MKKNKLLPVILIVLVVAIVLGFLGYRKYQDQFAYINEVRYEKKVEALDLSGQPLGNPEELKPFTELKLLDLRDTGITAGEYESVKSWLPETEILWDIPFQGQFYPQNTAALTVTALTREDIAALAYFTELKTVSAEDCPDYAALHELRMQRPDLELRYTVPVCGENYGYDVTELVLPGADAAVIGEVLPYLTELKAVELTAPLAPVEEILALRESFPDITFSWHLELAGIPVDEFTETLDLTGIPMTVEEMDAVLPYLLNLTYVDMTDCGISNEEMEALNNRYENIKIVWTVILGSSYRMRTDATFFHPVQFNYYPKGDELYNLRYCHDIIMLDVGHMFINDCEFVAFMPHLKYLILAETTVHDLTPLTGLKELVYLELFIMRIDDFSPLLTLTALEDLNLHYTDGDVNIIAQMTWLKNLWWNNVDYKRLTKEEQQLLRDSIPGCNFDFTSPSSTGGKWRELPNYYAQRDAAGTYYMFG